MLRRPLKLSLVMLLAVCAAPLPPAHAGEYDVQACRAANGVVNSWAPRNTNPVSIAVYNRCAEGGTGEGLVARNVVHPDRRAASGNQGEWSFTAPEGAGISGAAIVGEVQANSSGWFGSLSFERGPFNDTTIMQCQGQSNVECRRTMGAPGSPEFRFAGSPARALVLQVLCFRTDNEGCAQSGAIKAYANLFSVSVRITDDSAPGLGALGGLWGDGWQRGRRRLSYQANDNVGIRSQRMTIDGRAVADDALPCDYTRAAPCDNVGNGAMDAETAQFADGRHRLRVEVVDTAGNPAAAERDVLFDNTAPGAIPGLAVTGGDGWRRDNAFDVTWRKPTAGANQSPITGLRYQICRGSDCSAVRALPADTTKVENAEVPGGEVGEATFRLWAVDEAGNEDKSKGSTVPLRFDNLAPDSVLFDPPDPGDPRRLAAKVIDRGSGLAAGRVEVRRAGQPNFVPLPSRVDGDRVIAQFDDEGLPDGAYEVRAIAADRAGNEATGDKRADGTAATLTSPLRALTRLDVDFVRSLRARGRRSVATASRTRITARSGRRVLIGGILTFPDGRPVPGAEIVVYATADRLRAKEGVEGRVTTRPSGRFRYTSPAGTSRTLRFRYEGTPTVRFATAGGKISVPARLTLKANRKVVGRNDRITFSGRVTTRPRPVRGAVVVLQAFNRGRWRTFASARTTRQGGFRYRYRFSGRRGSYKVRAVLRKQPTYPFSRGTSNLRRFRVR